MALMSPITSAAARVRDGGTKDVSKKQRARVPLAIPQHLAKIFIFAAEGKTKPQLLSGVERFTAYGETTFDERSPYFNHATMLAQRVNAEGNAAMLERVVPTDAGPNATIRFSLDVLPITVDRYARNADGTIATDTLGQPVLLKVGNVVQTTPGYKVKLVVDFYDTALALQDFGQAQIVAGDQTDAVNNVQSQRYPLFEKKFYSQGSNGNLAGVRIWAPTEVTTGFMPTAMMEAYQAYPYYLSLIRKPDALSSPAVVKTMMNEDKISFTFKPGVVDPTYDRDMYLKTAYFKAYQNLTDPTYPKIVAPFDEVVVYDDNIDALLTMFHTTEAPFINAFSDITTDVASKHLFNFISGRSSQNVPYESYVFVDAQNSVRLTEYTNVYARGGSDGTMNDTVFAQLVSERMQAYADANNEVQDIAYNVESIIYDSGFPLETKKDLCKFISQRRDTFVVLGTCVAGDPPATASEEHSIATVLRTYLRNFPESDYFGTPVTRGMIMGRSGLVIDSKYDKRLPLTYEVAGKFARYMGAGDGKWKDGSSPEGYPGHIVDTMYDLNITWVPDPAKAANWSVGLNWICRYDRDTYYIPCYKTVYDDDTSVLNNALVALAICQLNKVAHSVYRDYVGRSDLSGLQLVAKCNTAVAERTAGRFNDRYIIVPAAFLTDEDTVNGFSWTLPIKIGANNTPTVMTTYVEAYRGTDLSTSN